MPGGGSKSRLGPLLDEFSTHQRKLRLTPQNLCLLLSSSAPPLLASRCGEGADSKASEPASHALPLPPGQPSRDIGTWH